MAPHGAQPFSMGLIFGIAGDAFEVVNNVVTAHLLQAPQQVAGVVQHDAGVTTVVDQFGDEVGDAGIAPGKDVGVVVIAFTLVFKHVLEITDQLSVGPGGDGWVGACVGHRQTRR